MTQEQLDTTLLLILSIVVFASWVPPFVLAIHRYRQERSYRAFRAGFMATMLQLALFRGLVASIVRAFPQAEFISTLGTVAGVIALALLLSGGIALTLTWALEHGWRPPWNHA